jgi:thiol-disulfide isomerase/thioredoxin
MDYEQKYLKYKSKYLQLKNNLNFQTGGGDDKPIVSLFKSEQCGHCKNFKPNWNDLQTKHPDVATYQTFDSQNNNLKFAANNINGVPTILKTYNNETTEYQGDRSVDDLVNWIQN